MSEGLPLNSMIAELERRRVIGETMQHLLNESLFKPYPTATVHMTWRERFAALNRFQWRRFWRGERIVFLPQPDALKGLEHWVPADPVRAERTARWMGTGAAE